MPLLSTDLPTRMPQYRGNVGNLLQHWVLCELIDLCGKHWTQIHFVDAYSMEPFATERFKSGWSASLFDHARDRSAHESVYERTWRRLVPGGLKNTPTVQRS